MPAAGERAARLLAAMTLEDKVAVALGDFEAVAHLGVPALRYADGPNGIRGPDNVTAFPASLALAATFDEGLAAAYGTAIASEAATPAPTSCSARRSTSPGCRWVAGCRRRWARTRTSPAGSRSPRSAPSRTPMSSRW